MQDWVLERGDEVGEEMDIDAEGSNAVGVDLSYCGRKGKGLFRKMCQLLGGVERKTHSAGRGETNEGSDRYRRGENKDTVSLERNRYKSLTSIALAAWLMASK